MSPLFIFFVTLIFGVPVLCFVYIFAENHLIVPRDVHRFENRVTKLLDKDGYKWERHEGDLYVFKNDVRFSVKCFRMPNRPAIRVFFKYTILDETLQNVSPGGQIVLTTELTVDDMEIPTRVENNVICSVYKADVRNARDFVQEFNYAYGKFGAMMQTLEHFRPQIQQIFPASAEEETHVRKIGFN